MNNEVNHKNVPYQVGDWVIHDYEIAQVRKVEYENVTEVSTGFFNTSGRSFNACIRPLTLKSKVVAESIGTYYIQLRALRGSNSFNFPDIHRHFSDLSMQAIDFREDGRNDGLDNPFIEKAKDFVQKFRDKINEYDEVDGIEIFRR